MNKRKNKKVLSKNVYSIDMVRLRVRVRSDLIKDYFDKFSFDSNVEYWESTRIKEYRHQWRIVDVQEVDKPLGDDGLSKVLYKGNSFWVGYQHNMENKSLKHWLVIEYNPNKLDINKGVLGEVLKKFYSDSSLVEIVSVDLACDMPVSISNVFCDKGGKSIKKLFDYGGDNKTIYIGEGSGRIKIYNKANELLKKQGIDIGYDLTRYEISIQLNNGNVPFTIDLYNAFCESSFNLVPIYCLESYQYDMSLNETDKALLYAVLNGYPLEALSRRKKENIEKILSESAGNTLESIGFVNAFKEYFKKHTSILHQI